MKHRLHPIPMTVQLARLTKAYPSSHATLKRDILTWTVDLTPTPLSRTYRVKLEMHKDGKPEVRLVYPKLQTRDGKRCPHLYPEGVLCLYLPGAFEWTKEMQLVETIVPWISEWLAHYEVWLSTGVWTGGGEHPEVKTVDGRRRAAPVVGPGTLDRASGTAIEAGPPEIEVSSSAVAELLDATAAVSSPTVQEPANG